mgnify:CR=1 FL=1
MSQQRILIANRGEIALRIIRSAKEMDMYTIAVYSDADEDALHVKRADEAYYLGSSLPAESYRNLKKLVKAATDTFIKIISMNHKCNIFPFPLAPLIYTWLSI